MWIKIVRKFVFFDAFELTMKTKRPFQLLQTLVVVVEAWDREVPRLFKSSHYGNTFASTKAWCPYIHFLLLVRHKFVVCICALLHHATTPPLVVIFFLLYSLRLNQWLHWVSSHFVFSTTLADHRIHVFPCFNFLLVHELLIWLESWILHRLIFFELILWGIATFTWHGADLVDYFSLFYLFSLLCGNTSLVERVVTKARIATRAREGGVLSYSINIVIKRQIMYNGILFVHYMFRCTMHDPISFHQGN